MSEFRRGLRKPQMIAALAELAAKESWWRDVLRDPSLVIGVRDDYLNVYWRGQSLFMAQMKRGRIVATTHPKYLLNPSLTGQVALDPETGLFAIDPATMITRAYRPGETLAKIKTAAALFAGEEKEGVQTIVSQNADVVDVEVAFPGETALRVDIASFEDQGDRVSLAFWEAKAFGNPELRATADKNVVSQIKAYIDLLNQHRASVLDSYRVIAENLLAFAGMSGGVRMASATIEKVATGAAPLTMPDPPEVGLIVFGFDKAQRDETWKPLAASLETRLGRAVVGRGDAKDIKLQRRERPTPPRAH